MGNDSFSSAERLALRQEAAWAQDQAFAYGYQAICLTKTDPAGSETARRWAASYWTVAMIAAADAGLKPLNRGILP